MLTGTSGFIPFVVGQLVGELLGLELLILGLLRLELLGLELLGVSGVAGKRFLLVREFCGGV